MSETLTNGEVVEAAPMSTEERLIRVDTLLCILFAGLTSHPLASTLVPPAELAQLRAILPRQ